MVKLSSSGSSFPNTPTRSARLSALGPPGTVLWLSRSWPVRTDAGHRFNPNKLVLDPYAKQLVGGCTGGRSFFGYQLDHADKDLSYDERDSAPLMQKCRRHRPGLHWGAHASRK